MNELLGNKEVIKYLADHETIETEHVEHKVYNFVDDSNSTLCFDNQDDINPYITAYLLLMIGFYNLNKLRINKSKTNLMVVERQKSKKTKKKIKI